LTSSTTFKTGVLHLIYERAPLVDNDEAREVAMREFGQKSD
jgi:hypothetical protein